MLSKNKIKFIQSLARKKARDQNGLFVAEGAKTIQQLDLAGYNFHSVFITENSDTDLSNNNNEVVFISENEMKKVSMLKTPSQHLAVCHIKESDLSKVNPQNELVFALDQIQDPGNMGTIIRLASWFGIKHIVCSLNTVDCYNPKVVQATMGALAHTEIHYTNLEQYLEGQPEKCIIYGTFLEGTNIYNTKLSQNGIVVLGNEGNGISSNVEKHISQKLHIPAFGKEENVVESLNVSMAASIICSEFRRRDA